jgi:hypothetical protein
MDTGDPAGKIECDCEDNGSLTIPASMLDKLKTYGISGFPKLEIARYAIDVNAFSNAKIVLESRVTMMLDIPGVISCNGDDECPEGQTCGTDFRCQ